MNNRQFNQVLFTLIAGGPLVLCSTTAAAYTQFQARDALRQSLQAGSNFAVKQLGTLDGFWGSEKVRIPLPAFLEQGRRLLKTFGQQERLEALHMSVNRAAESAVSQALPLLKNAVSSLSTKDAVNILKGGNTAVTDYFESVTREPLTAQFLPTVQQATQQNKAAEQYAKLLKTAQRFGVGQHQPATVAEHVTLSALNSLYATVAEAEQQLRANPGQAATRVLRQVFGNL